MGNSYKNPDSGGILFLKSDIPPYLGIREWGICITPHSLIPKWCPTKFRPSVVAVVERRFIFWHPSVGTF